MSSICEFRCIRRRDNLPIQVKGIEKSWPELQQEFHRTGPGYPNAIYYKRISSVGPQLFAVVDKKWVLYHEKNAWHRYLSACDLHFETLPENGLISTRMADEQQDESWVIVSNEDCIIEDTNNFM